MAKADSRLSEIWGGLAAMLVALPSAIAFGLMMYAPLGAQVASQGAMTGILGTVAMGILAAAFGGTPRLISAPCAPAAAVMGALAGTLMSQANGGGPISSAQAILLLGLVGLMAGLLQLTFGAVGGGKLIKFIPYPVVAGYLSGVGVLIFLSQLPKFLALPKNVPLASGLISPSEWRWQAMAVGTVTMAVMLLAPRMTKAVPAPILGLTGGMLTYFGLGLLDGSLLVLDGNALLIGPISAGGASPWAMITDRWTAVGLLHFSDLKLVLAPALTLGVLLSIDTLKTCVVVDALTRSRHDSNRELIGQGLGNVGSALIGGMPGAGTMGATLVNVSSGGKTRLSSMLEGVFALMAFVLLGPLVAWVPLSALAGILIVVAFRMVDRHSLSLLKQRSTVVDFLVVAAVILTAVTVGLMPAAGVGVALAILLFLRESIRDSVVRRRALGNAIFSKKRRLQKEMEVLERDGTRIAVFQLQGSLFFGSTDQLSTELEPHLKERRYIILDMRRVRSVDFTAAHMLELLEARLTEQGGTLVFADLPQAMPGGQDLTEYLGHLGLMKPSGRVKIFATLDDALEWAEDQLLMAAGVLHNDQDPPNALDQLELFSGLPPQTLETLKGCVQERTVANGQKVFSQGDAGDELVVIRKGAVRIQLGLENGKALHLATFGRGDFFGDMSFLDGGTRSADAVAIQDTDVFTLSRASFDKACETCPALGRTVFLHFAQTLAARLRHTDRELRVLQES